MDKRLVIITQKVDEHDDLLGFFVGWIAELAKHFSHIDVITLGTGSYKLPDSVSVHSLGKEQGVPKLFQYARFFSLAARLIPGSVGVFAHMSPIFAVLAWPFALVSRSKLIFWYLHRSVTMKLRLAALVSSAVVTADVESLGIRSGNIIPVGHGIDVGKFSVVRKWDTQEHLRIVSVGRISPIKNLETLVEALAHTTASGHSIRARIVGKPVMAGDMEYDRKIRALVTQHGLDDMVSFAGFISHDRIVSVYAEADVAIGLTPPGGIDKVLLEAMASGCIVLTSNSVMKKYFGSWGDRLIFEYGNAQHLASQLAWVAQSSPQERVAISRALQESVERHHNLRTMIQRILATIR